MDPSTPSSDSRSSSSAEDDNSSGSVSSLNVKSAQARGSLSGLHTGYTLVASVIIGLGLGYWIDTSFGTQPWWTVGGALLFIIAGLYQVVKETGGDAGGYRSSTRD